MHSCPRERHSGFGVFPQNAKKLGIHFPDYLETVTGIGVEDLYYGYPRDHQPHRLADNAYARSRARGFVTVRSLGLLIINGGQERHWKGVANTAHARGLSVGLKYDLEQVVDLEPFWAAGTAV